MLSLQDVSIGDNSVIDLSAHLSSATVGSNCNIGPYARLREGSEIGNNAKLVTLLKQKNKTRRWSQGQSSSLPW